MGFNTRISEFYSNDRHRKEAYFMHSFTALSCNWITRENPYKATAKNIDIKIWRNNQTKEKHIIKMVGEVHFCNQAFVYVSCKQNALR